MFKKTLLALAVAGASLSATAGTITAGVTETANQAATTTPTIAGTAQTAAVNLCAQIATTLKVTVNNNGNTPNNAAVNDTVTVTGQVANQLQTTSSVTMTGTDACTVSVAEGLVGASTAKYSQEAANAKGVTVTAKQISGVGGFKAEDTIIFTFEGATIDDSTTPPTLTDGQNTTIPYVNVVNGNTVLFQFPTGYATSRARDILTLNNVVVKGNLTKINVSSQTKNTGNIIVDNSAAATVVELAKQYSAKVHVKGDGIIDVQEQRLLFASNDKDSADAFMPTDDTTANDTFVVEVTENTTQGNLTPKTGTLVIKGNFSWLMDYAGTDGKLSSAEIATAITHESYDSLAVGANAGQGTVGGADDTLDATKYALNTAMNELTVVLGAGADNDIDKYHSFTLKPKGSTGTTALAESNYTATLNYINDKTADTTTADVTLNVATDAAVASWTLNGSVVNVPYIPFGPNTQPIIRHTNKGVQTGDISLRYMVEGSAGNTETNTWKSLGVIVKDAKPGVRDLLGVITEKLTAELGTNKFKVALEITTNVPKEDVTVFAAAKVTAEGQDRLTIGAFGGQ